MFMSFRQQKHCVLDITFNCSKVFTVYILISLMFSHMHFQSNKMLLIEVSCSWVCGTSSLCDWCLTFCNLMVVSH
jgi:hypothetical protein